MALTKQAYVAVRRTREGLASAGNEEFFDLSTISFARAACEYAIEQASRRVGDWEQPVLRIAAVRIEEIDA